MLDEKTGIIHLDFQVSIRTFTNTSTNVGALSQLHAKFFPLRVEAVESMLRMRKAFPNNHSTKPKYMETRRLRMMPP
jgi:hypothetical protein